MGRDADAGGPAREAGAHRAGLARLPRPLGDVDRGRQRHPGARASGEGGGGARRRGRGLEPGSRSAGAGRLGTRRRRLRRAEGLDDAARARDRLGLGGCVGAGCACVAAELLLRLGADAEGAGEAREPVHSRRLADRRARRLPRPAARRRIGERVRATHPPRPHLPGRNQGDGARALLPRRRSCSRGHGGPDAGRHRLERADAGAAGAARRHDRRRPRPAQGGDLPDWPHRLVRRVRHRHGAERGGARPARARRSDRAGHRRLARARGLRRGDAGLKVLVREQIADAGIELLRSRFDVDEDRESPIEEIIGGYDAIVIRSATKLSADVIDRAAQLKVIGRAGVGVDNVDVNAATRRGIVVANAPDSTVVSAAEHTIGLLVALARNIPQAHAALKAGRWERSRWGGIELADKTLGVLGFGRIGNQVARRALGLGMRVVGYDPFVAPERFRELGVEHASTPDEVFAAAEFLTLHLPLTDDTRGFVDADALARMRDGVRIVNAARGELVDESALAQAVRDGKVAGAALDVFSAEPYSGELLGLDNVVVTPHLAASTEEAQDRAGVIVAEQVVAALEGGLVTNALNIPIVGAEDLELLGPYIPLSAKLGRLAVELAGGHPRRIALSFNGTLAGYDTRLLTVAALNGAFQGRADQPVNYVNAPVVAAEQGIEVGEERRRQSRDFTNLVRVDVTGADEDVRVAGTTIGRDNRRWLVSALGFELDIELAPLMVFFRYDDIPGVIGRVGTLFGDAGVNIANMAVSRTRRGDKALMALSVDEPPPPELVERFRAEGFDDARFVRLG